MFIHASTPSENLTSISVVCGGVIVVLLIVYTTSVGVGAGDSSEILKLNSPPWFTSPFQQFQFSYSYVVLGVCKYRNPNTNADAVCTSIPKS